MRLIREGHIDPDDDADDDDADLGDDIIPTSAVEPGWENENNSTPEPPSVPTLSFITPSPP